MTVVVRTLSLAIVAVAFVSPVRADDQAEMRKVIEKAIKAQGGAEALAKHPATTVNMKGKWYGMGEGIEYTGTFSTLAPKLYRFELTMKIGNDNFTMIQAIKNDKGWMSFNGNVTDLGKDAIAEAREGLHLHQVSQLVCLLGKDYKLSPVGEVQVEKKPAIGVRVEFKGRRDINLFFDKESGLLVKTETRSKDPMMGDQDFSSETYYSDYKKVGDVMVAHKILLHRDGKLYVDGETTGFTAGEKLDDAIFAKP